MSKRSQQHLDQALFDAISEQKIMAAGRALRAGANPDACHPITGEPAMACIITNIYSDKLSSAFARLLLKHHGDPNAESKEQENVTSLMLCVLHEKPKTAHALIYCGDVQADIYAQHPTMGTAHEMAKDFISSWPSSKSACHVLRVLAKAEYIHDMRTELAEEFNTLQRKHIFLMKQLERPTPVLNIHILGNKRAGPMLS